MGGYRLSSFALGKSKPAWIFDYPMKREDHLEWTDFISESIYCGQLKEGKTYF